MSKPLIKTLATVIAAIYASPARPDLARHYTILTKFKGRAAYVQEIAPPSSSAVIEMVRQGLLTFTPSTELYKLTFLGRLFVKLQEFA